MESMIFILMFIVSLYLTNKTTISINGDNEGHVITKIILFIFFFSLYLFVGLLVLASISKNI
jgi:hypothetical protein